MSVLKNYPAVISVNSLLGYGSKARLIVNSDNEYGNLISTEDAMGNEISYEYDSGKVTSITDEIGTYMKMTYDGDGNVVSAVNGAGETATFTYDEDGNCAFASYAITVK